MKKSKKIIIAALLLASQIVLGRILSIRTPILTIGFGFVPLMLCAIILGKRYSIINAMLSDIIGALLFPIGPYFVGFTISAGLKGFIYGLLLYQKDGFKVNLKFVLKMLAAVLISNFIVNGILNSLWIHIISNYAAKFINPVRWIKQLIMIPVEMTTIYLLSKIFHNQIKDLKS